MNKFYFWIFPVMLAVSFLACKKRYATKLEGQWEKVKIIDMEATFTEYWVFGRAQSGAAGDVTALTISNGTTKDTLSIGKYHIESNILHNYIVFENFLASVELGNKWEIVKMNKSEMVIIFREKGKGGMMLLEFCRTSCQ